MMNFKETFDFMTIAFKCNIVPLLLGHTGIGKTELVSQWCIVNGYGLIVIHVAQLEPSDFVGLYQIENKKTYNCQPAWLPDSLINNAEKCEISGVAVKGWVIFLDEINRGHEDIRQALYQLITANKIHTYQLPSNCHIVAAANPFDDYEVYDFDKALKNRFAWVQFKPDADETLEYLGKQKFDGLDYKNSHFYKFIGTDKALLDYGSDFKIDDMILSPRLTEKAIRMDLITAKMGMEFKRKCLETLCRKEVVSAYLSYLKEVQFINFKDVLAGEKKEKQKQVIEEKRLDVISTILSDMGEWVKGKKKYKDEEVINMVSFLMEIPNESCVSFFDMIKDFQDNPLIKHKDFQVLRTKLDKFTTIKTK